MAWEEIDSPVKKMFRAQWSVSKVKLTVFSDMKRPIIIDFLEKDATVNRISYQNSLNNISHYSFIDLVVRLNSELRNKICAKRKSKLFQLESRLLSGQSLSCYFRNITNNYLRAISLSGRFLDFLLRWCIEKYFN